MSRAIRTMIELWIAKVKLFIHKLRGSAKK